MHSTKPIIGMIVLAGLIAGCSGTQAGTAAPSPAATAEATAEATSAAPTAGPTATPIPEPKLSGEAVPINTIWEKCGDTLKVIPVTFTGAVGEDIQGAVLGDGETGIVLSNQSDNDPCVWVSFAQALVDAKYRVLMYHYGNGYGYDEAIAGSQVLIQNGAKHVILVGGSLGGAFTAAAAAKNPPGVAAAVTLSAAIVVPPQDPTPLAGQIKIPIMLVTADVDPAGSLKMAKDIFAGLTISDKQLVIVPHGPHGAALMDDPDTRGKVMAFLEAHHQ